MTDSPPPAMEDTDEIWRRMVEEYQAVWRTQARFWRAPAATERLISALSSSTIERSVALEFLRELSVEDPQIMEQLLDSSTAMGSAAGEAGARHVPVGGALPDPVRDPGPPRCE